MLRQPGCLPVACPCRRRSKQAWFRRITTFTVTRSVFSTLATFQPSVGSFGLNLVSRLRVALAPRVQTATTPWLSVETGCLQPRRLPAWPRGRPCRLCYWQPCKVLPVFRPNRLLTLRCPGGPGFSSSTFRATDERDRLTRPHWFLGILPPSSLWSMTAMLFLFFTTVGCHGLFARWLSCFHRPLSLVAIAGGDVEIWDYRLCPGYVCLGRDPLYPGKADLEQAVPTSLSSPFETELFVDSGSQPD